MAALLPLLNVPLLVYQSPLYVAPAPFCSTRVAVGVGFVVGVLGVVVGVLGVVVGVVAPVDVPPPVVLVLVPDPLELEPPPVEPPVPGLPALKSTRYSSEYSVGNPDCF